MKTSILIATSSLQAVQAAQATGSIVNDGCEAIKWNGEKIPFQEQLSFLYKLMNNFNSHSSALPHLYHSTWQLIAKDP